MQAKNQRNHELSIVHRRTYFKPENIFKAVTMEYQTKTVEIAAIFKVVCWWGVLSRWVLVRFVSTSLPGKARKYLCSKIQKVQ